MLAIRHLTRDVHRPLCFKSRCRLEAESLFLRHGYTRSFSSSSVVSEEMRALIGKEMARVGAQTAVGEAAELIMQAKPKNNITIYGPQDDSTYRFEFRTRRKARDLGS